MLVWRTGAPFAVTAAMHHWHSGLPPLPYLWVLRWQVAQGPTWLPEQTSAEGSGSVIGAGEWSWL